MTGEPVRHTFAAIPTSDHKEDTMTTTTTERDYHPSDRATTQARLDAALIECRAARDRAVSRELARLFSTRKPN